MNVLIVEDDKATISVLEDELRKLGVLSQIAESKSAALAALERGDFDLVVNDLKIPSVENALDADKVHGLAVHAHVRKCSEGTPILVLTGFGTFSLAQELYEKAPRCDVWASGDEIPLTRIFKKDQMRECLDAIALAKAKLDAAEAVEISYGTSPLILTPKQRRILKLFGRFNNGANVRVQRLGGGLSDTEVFKVTVEDLYGVPLSFAAAKVGAIELLEDEFTRYQTSVSPILKPGGFAPVIRFCKAGAGNMGGLFYSLAGAGYEPLFKVLLDRPAEGPAIVRQLRLIEEPWQLRPRFETRTVGDVRRIFISDEMFSTIASTLGFDWQMLESKSINLPLSCQHLDLHGLNVLVCNRTDPLMIDYGEVGMGPACVDALILELSILFHPQADDLRAAWPTMEQAEKWDDVNAFSDGSALAEYIRSCRDWAHSVATRDSAVYAAAYSFAVRQLKYTNTRHDLAIAIARTARRRLTET